MHKIMILKKSIIWPLYDNAIAGMSIPKLNILFYVDRYSQPQNHVDSV